MEEKMITEEEKLLANFAGFNKSFHVKNKTILNGRAVDIHQMLTLARAALVTERGAQVLEAYDIENLRYVEGFVAGNCRPWLLLMGKPGTGKTTYLHAIRRIAIFCNRGDDTTINFVRASETGELMKNDPEKYQRIKNSDLLFIDDLAFGGESEMVNNYGVRAYPIEDILEKRYDTQKITVMTTNLGGDQLRKHYGDRIYSRLCEMCNTLVFNGEDLRQKNK